MWIHEYSNSVLSRRHYCFAPFLPNLWVLCKKYLESFWYVCPCSLRFSLCLILLALNFNMIKSLFRSTTQWWQMNSDSLLQWDYQHLYWFVLPWHSWLQHPSLGTSCFFWLTWYHFFLAVLLIFLGLPFLKFWFLWICAQSLTYCSSYVLYNLIEVNSFNYINWTLIIQEISTSNSNYQK